MIGKMFYQPTIVLILRILQMSRNNKNARLHAEAREWSKLRTGGGKGPSRTNAVHGKKNVKYRSSEVMAARNAVVSKSVDNRTVLEKLKGTED
jgi:hypothetical protein